MIVICICCRHGGQFNSEIRIDYLKKKMELELINFELELKFCTKNFYPQINFPFNFSIQ